MFDNVGTTLDAESGRRQATASLITSLVVSAAVTFGVVVGSWTAVKIVALHPPEPMVVVEFIPSDVIDLPDAPPLLPRLGGGSVAKASPADEPAGSDEPEPEEMAEIKELSPTPVHVRLTPPKRRGFKAGSGDVNKPGPPGPGTANGTRNGTGIGGGTKGLTILHHTETRLRRRIDPIYPPVAEGSATCMVRINISIDGKPDALRITGCAPIFEQAARNAMVRWKWARPKVNGINLPVQTVYRINFRPER